MNRAEVWKPRFKPDWRDRALFWWVMANLVAAVVGGPVLYWDLNW